MSRCHAAVGAVGAISVYIAMNNHLKRTTMNNEEKTKGFGRFWALMGELPWHPDMEVLKADLVRQYTGGRTVHLHEMRPEEYEAMCRGMQRSIERERLRRPRSVCLHLMQDLGIDTGDWSRVDSFCKDPRIAGKMFRFLTVEDLDRLHRKLRAIKKHGGLPGAGTRAQERYVRVLMDCDAAQGEC